MPLPDDIALPPTFVVTPIDQGEDKVDGMSLMLLMAALVEIGTVVVPFRDLPHDGTADGGR